MSVIVRTPSNEIRIYCKGAETVVLPRLKYYTPDAVGKLQDKLSAAEYDYIAQTEQHINHYARKGLRTLLVSMATMDQAQFDRWLYVYQKAAIAVHHRKDKVARAAELIERDLLLLGATAIEDKLQHGVPETLRDLARAGIKVWVLTGDKQETAINIGYSAHVLDETMELLCVNTSNTQACQHTLGSFLARLQAAGPTKKCALIIDGLSLGFALEDHKVQFRELSKLCQSVICCRVSAKQKAAVVSLIKAEGHTTLAIGDGANDVSMIRSAHVGIGIIGKEGSQASRSSDYAIAQFRFLKKLLLVHGRYSYLRISTLIQYYFYKNATFTLPQFYFSFFNGFSGQTLFDSWIIVLFNIVFTSLPVLLVGLWDRDVPQEALLQFPSLYSRSRLNKEFNFKAHSALSFLCPWFMDWPPTTCQTFFWWLGSAVLHSALIFFFALVISTAVLPNGHPMDMFLFGITISTSAITIVTLKLALETNTWTVFHHLVFWGSLGVYFFFISIYGLIPHVRGWDNHIYWAFFTLFTSSSFWLTYVALVVCSLLPDLTFKIVLRCFFPSDWSVMREYWLRVRLRQRTAAYYGFLSAAANTQGGDETKPLVCSHAH